MTIAVEPIVNLGSKYCQTLRDGWTVITKDGSLSAQWEHTVLVTKNGYEILKEKNYIHASKKFSEALKTNPKNKFALLLRAYSKKELKDYKSALKDLNTILKIDSEYNAAVALRAWVNIKLENYPEAIDDYSKLIAYDLMLKDSYGNRGFLKEIMQDKEGACSDWQKGGALGNEKASSAFENHCKSV